MIRFFLSIALTVLLLIVLGRPLQMSDTTLPPLGKFFSPSHGFWQNAERGGPKDAILRFQGVEDKIIVEIDERGVPHVFAQNDADLYFAQGYLTARDRLWQMDMGARSTAGRISEILGSRALEYDKSQRNIGLGWAAERTFAAWQKDPDAMAPVEAYAAGVNAYINTLKPREYPLEFKLLDYAPEEWKPVNSALLIKAMSKTLCYSAYDLYYSSLLDILGEEQFHFLFPDRNPAQDPIIPPGTAWDFDPLENSSTNQPVPSSVAPPLGSVQTTDPDIELGSNNWAVSGSKTASGRPILCSDPHLTLSLPSIWYEVHLNAPSVNCYGVSLPGMPGIIIGFNEHIAWGATNVGMDMRDYYEISWADERKTQYTLDGDTVDVTWRIEEIRTKEGDVVLDSVRYTHWGPVVNSGQGEELAMRWIAHEVPPAAEAGVFTQGINRAEDLSDFLAALDNYHSPAQNFVYADTDGNVAMRIGGVIPLRKRESGKFIQDGSHSSNGWSRTIPPSHNPVVVNPDRGFVSSANQRTTDGAYPYYYDGGRYFEDYRGRILNRYLADLDNATYTDMAKIQNDNYSLKAEEVLGAMIGAVDSLDLDQTSRGFIEELGRWDRTYSNDSKAAHIFEVWFDEICELTWAELYGLRDSLLVLRPEDWRTIDLILNQPNHAVFDIGDTERRESFGDIALFALGETVDRLGAEPQTWGEARLSTIEHLANLPGMNRTLSLAGHGDALNAQGRRAGPSWRMIVEMTDPPRGRVVYPGGQSGNPGSPYYDNLIDTWAAGQHFEAHFTSAPGEIEGVTTVMIERKGK